MTLADFLLARIEEEQAQLPLGILAWDEHRRVGWARADPHGSVSAARSRLEKQKAECEAKRRIVDALSNTGWATYAVRDVILALLALPYADHPDYRDEWRP